MTPLSLSLFTAAHDEEAGRYRVLGGLQHVRKAFARNEVYPYLGDLIRLFEALEQVSGAADALLDRQRGPVRGLDLEEGRLLYEEAAGEPLLAEALIRWALPQLQEAIEEGRTLYEFVDDHAALQAVGIVPAYQDEGYLFVPDGGALCVLRYAVSLFDRPDGRYRSIRTAVVGSAPAGTPAPEVKRDLVARLPDLPNPAAYQIETDLDLPLEPTVLPVAKRKLLQYLAVGGRPGAA